MWLYECEVGWGEKNKKTEQSMSTDEKIKKGKTLLWGFSDVFVGSSPDWHLSDLKGTRAFPELDAVWME